MNDHEPNIGEVGRTVARIEAAQLKLTEEVRSRHHEIANKVNDALAPISTLTERVKAISVKQSEMEKEIRRLVWMAAAISGAISMASFLLTRFHI